MLHPKASALTSLAAVLPTFSLAPASSCPSDSSSRCQKAATAAMLMLAATALRVAALGTTQVCSCWLMKVPSRRGHSPWSGSAASGVEGSANALQHSGYCTHQGGLDCPAKAAFSR